MVDFRELKLGDSIDYKGREFDGKFEYHGIVTEICNDHAIVTVIMPKRNMNLWLDNDSDYFYVSKRKTNLDLDYKVSGFDDRIFTFEQLKEVYRDIAEKFGDYENFNMWFCDQIEKSNIVEA